MKILFCLLFSILSLLIFTDSVFANDFMYCTQRENTTCVKQHDTFTDFVNNFPSNLQYPETGLTVEGDWLYFTQPHFEFYVNIPDVIELKLLTDSEDYGLYFDTLDWIEVDEDRNMVHDDIDEIVEMFNIAYEDYFGRDSSYNLEPWDGRLTVWVSPYAVTESVWGKFDSNGVLKIDPFYSKNSFLPTLYSGYSDRSKRDVEATVVHELFHVIQSLYIEKIWEGLDYRNDNFLEGTAVLMQSKMVHFSDSFLARLWSSPLLNPQVSIFGSTVDQNYGVNYGSFIWYTFLYEEYGKSMVKDMLEAYGEASDNLNDVNRNFNAINDALEKHDSNIVEAYLEYVVWNYDNTKYEDGRHFLDVKIEKSHSKFPTGTVTIGNNAPALFASNYIEFDVNSKEENLKVDFNANGDADFYVSFLSVSNGKVDYGNTVEYFVEKGGSNSFLIPLEGRYDTIIMISSVLTGDLDTLNIFSEYSYPYSYSAERSKLISVEKNRENLSDLEASDFFVLDADQSWDYIEVFSGDDFGINYETLNSIECNSKEDCVTYDYGEYQISYRKFGDHIYEYIADNFLAEVKHLSVKEFVESIDRDLFVDLFDLGMMQDNVTQIAQGCSPSFKEDYNFKSITKRALIQNCELSFLDNSGKKTLLKYEDVFLEKVGLVTQNSEFFYDNEPFYTAKKTLVNSSLLQIDTNPFNDLDSDHKNREAVLFLYKSGIISGYPDGTMRPDNTVNRAELLKILIEGTGVSPDLNQFSSCFPDVDNEWFAPYVCYAKSKGWIDGYPNGTFQPGNTVNNVEALKMLLNSQNIKIPDHIEDKPFNDVDVDAWFAPYVKVSKTLDILEENGDFYHPGQEMTRGGFSENLYRLLSN